MASNLIIGINLGDFGSTGNIMRNALEHANEHGDFDYLVIVPHSEGKPNTYAYLEQNNLLDKIDRYFIHKSIGNPDGLYEYRTTKRIVNKIKEVSKNYNKVIVHLHNIHMASIDFRYFFKYLSKEKRVTKVLYTLHDSWPFTGGCYCFNFVKCFEWKKGCKCECCQNYGTKNYPVNKIYELKKKYTLLLKDKLILIPVSNWMVNNLKQSFLKDIPYILNPGECSIIPLAEPDISLKKELGLLDKKVIISVSAYWNDWKGIKYIYEISKLLPENYLILLVGGTLEDKYKAENIIHVGNVNNEDLNKYFSISDLFLSTTQDDNLPLVLMEAQICGLPVIGFGHGGTPEEIVEGVTGTMVGTNNDVNCLVDQIMNAIVNKPYKKTDIIANGNKYKKYENAKRMLLIYNKLV